MQQTNLSFYNNYPFEPGGTFIKRVLWHYLNAIIFKTGLLPFSGMKAFLLRAFGANIGVNGLVKMFGLTTS
jgi:putative colanic acid biosynthesis acetyltransferase WcaF